MNYFRTLFSSFFLFFLLFSCNVPALERSILETVNTIRFVQAQTTDYSLEFTVTGLLGTGLEVVQGADTVLVDKDGSYTFKTKLLTQSTYNVTIKSQPKSPEQKCEVVAGQGTVIRGNVNTIRINCGEAIATTINLTGTVNGLQGSGLQISNTTSSGTETINVNSTTFAFASILQGSSYSFAIVTQPSNPSQTCSITAPTNLSGTADRNNIALTVNCNTNAYSVQAQVTGIVGTLPGGGELQLMLNGSDTLNVTSNGTFSFPNPVKSGANFTVVIVNASGLISTGKCNIPTGTGTIGGTSATVLVNCTDGFAVQGTVVIGGGTASTVVGSGLQIRLSHTGTGPVFTSQDISIAADSTTFSFPSAIPGGSGYQITVFTQPSSPSQTCSITTGAGPSTITSNVTNVVLDCGLPSPSIVTPFPATYGNDLSTVTFSTPISGAEIRWNQGNGTQADPTCVGGSTGSPTITNNNMATIKFRQCRNGWTPSEVVTSTYTLKANTPSFSITPGSFVNSGQNLSFSSTTTSSWNCANFMAGTPPDPECGGAINTCSNGIVSASYAFSVGTSLNFKLRTCKVGYQQSDIASATYTFNQFSVGGTITGLTTPFGSNTFVLRNNGGDDLTISANGTFTFSTGVNSGNSYAVTVFSNPQNPWQTCTVTNGTGTIASSNITNVSIACTLNTYTMSGSVVSSVALPSGLSVSNGVDTINVTPGSTTTPLSFSTPINSGGTFNISVTAEPPGQICAVSSSMTGTILGANITNVGVNCVAGHRTGSSISNRFSSPMNIGTYRGNLQPVAGDSSSGYTDASGASARFGQITGLTFDIVWGYAADKTNHAIRRINPSNNAISSFIGNGTPGNVVSGIPSGAALNGPHGIVTDGTFLYISESLGNRIKRIRLSDSNIETLAGDDSVLSPANAFTDGTGTAARFAGPRGIYLDGERLFIADSGNNAIRVLNIRTRAVTTLTFDTIFFDSPDGLTVVGDTIYSTNSGNTRDCITATNKNTGANFTFAGTGGVAGFRDGIGVNNTRFDDPSGITHDDENLYVTDTGNNRVRKINIRSGEVTTVVGNGGNALVSGVGAEAYTTAPRAIARASETFIVAVDFAVRTMNDFNLVAHYRLKGNPDTSTGVNNLTPVGTPVYGLGRFGEANGAVVMSGSSYYTANRSLGGNNTLTMAGWFRWDGTGAGISRVLMYNGNSGANGSGLQLNSVNSLEILRGGVGVDSVNFYIPANVWVHLALAIFPNDTHRVYVNGKVVFEKVLAGNAVSNSFLLGSNGLGNNVFPGRISEVRLYNRVLGEGEISALAQDVDSSLVGATYDSQASQLLMNYKFWGNRQPAAPVGNTMTVTGTSNYAIGKEGLVDTSFRFDGATHLEGSSLGLPQGDHPRTACAWIFPENRPAVTEVQTIFRYGNTTGDTSFSLRIMNVSGVQTFIFGGVGAGVEYTVPYQVNLNRWSHVCGTVQSDRTVRLYVNGFEIGNGTLSSINTSGSNIVLVGAFNTGLFRFRGKITDFRVYSKALSQTEIRRIDVQNPVGLVAFFPLDGDATDNSGFGSNGSVTGSVSYVSDQFGVSNGALRVNGGLNFISAPDTFLPPGKSPRTLCMWYRAEASSTSIPFGYGNPSLSTALTYFWLENENIIRLWGQGADLNSIIPVRNFIWRHVCGTNDGAGTASGTMYVNGRLAVSGSHNITIVSDGLLRIGSSISGRQYIGSLDDLMVFNRVLSQDEIRALSSNHPMQVSSWNVSVGSSSLKLHLTADSLSNSTNGANVTAWADQSGNGGDFSNGSNSPTFSSAGIPFNTLTSRPSVSFVAASSQSLTRAATINGLPSDEFSFYAVFRRSNATANEGFFQSNAPTDGINFDFTAGSFNASQYPSLTFGLSNITSFNVSSQNYIAASHLIRNTIYEIFSQGQNALFTSNPTFGPWSGSSSSNFEIGRSNPNGHFTGEIAEILYFNSNLSATDRALMHCYLSQKYNIAVNPAVVCN